MKEKPYKLQDLRMEIIDKDLAKKLICKYHYSNTCGSIKIAFGFKLGKEIKNVITYTNPVGRQVSQEIIEGGDANNTLELIRMISIEPKPKNLESYCIHKTIDYIREYLPQFKVIVSMADNSVGHHGYCYQASGFTYYGQSAKHKEWYLDDKRVHEKTLYDKYKTTKLVDLKEILGDRIQQKEQEQTKSRYYYIVAQNKKEKKELEKKIKVKSLPYPKGDNKRYDVFSSNEFANINGENSSNITDVIEGQTSIFDFI